PEGKPIPGARLYLGYTRHQEKPDPVRATTGEDGSFKFTFARSELDTTYSDEPSGQVIAVARGYGCNWATISPKDKQVILRLVKDVPIRGRILDQEGKPVAGAKVRVTDVRAYKGEDLKEELEELLKGGMDTRAEKAWAGLLPGQPSSVTTGPDGRFRL